MFLGLSKRLSDLEKRVSKNPDVNPDNPDVNPDNPDVNPDNPDTNPDNPDSNNSVSFEGNYKIEYIKSENEWTYNKITDTYGNVFYLGKRNGNSFANFGIEGYRNSFSGTYIELPGQIKFKATATASENIPIHYNISDNDGIPDSVNKLKICDGSYAIEIAKRHNIVEFDIGYCQVQVRIATGLTNPISKVTLNPQIPLIMIEGVTIYALNICDQITDFLNPSKLKLKNSTFFELKCLKKIYEGSTCEDCMVRHLYCHISFFEWFTGAQLNYQQGNSDGTGLFVWIYGTKMSWDLTDTNNLADKIWEPYKAFWCSSEDIDAFEQHANKFKPKHKYFNI